MLPLHVEGLAVNEAKRLEVAVRSRTESRSGLRVQDGTSTTALVDSANDLGITCDLRAPACAAELGRVADADHVLAGTAARVVEGLAVDLVLVDTKTGTARRHRSALLSGDEMTALSTLVSLLFDDSAGHGFAVTASDGARVVVDGTVRGEGASVVVADLAAGSHLLVVEKQGFVSHRAVVDADAVVAPVVLVPLPETQLGIAELGGPIAVAGGGVALVVAGGIAAFVGADPGLRYLDTQSRLAGLSFADADYAEEAAALHDENAAAADAWNAGGRYLFWGGTAAVVVGVAASVAGTLWGVDVALGE